MPTEFVPCEDCHKPRLATVPRVRPPVCHPCRRIRRERAAAELAARKKPPLKWPVVTCAEGCGAERRGNPTLLPQGQYRCHACRRKGLAPKKPRKKACRQPAPPRQCRCIHCDKEFTLAAALGNRRTCSDECAAERKRERNRKKCFAYRQLRGAQPRVANPYLSCVHCNAQFIAGKNSKRKRKRKYCDACVEARVWPTMPRTSPRRQPCSICGVKGFTSPKSAKSAKSYVCHPCRGGPEHRASRKSNKGGDYRKRARHFGVEYEPVDKRKVFARDKWRCRIPGCGKPVDKTLKYPHPMSASLDHVVPMSKGGAHSYANTQCTHLKCNVDKGNRGHGEQLALVG